MPRPSLTITVPQPCHEDWNQMTPAAQGRHCAACQQVVVDFTRHTDAELLAYFRQARGPVCGRFAAGQLDRRVLPSPGLPARWHTWLAAAVALLGLRELAPTSAQAQAPPTAQHPPARILLGKPIRPNGAGTAVAPLVVRGAVLDSATQEGLPGVTVLLAGTHTGISTPADGRFALTLPVGTGPAAVLEFSAVGYRSQRVAVAALAGQPTVVLRPDRKGLSEIVVVGGCSTRWYAPRQLWWRLRHPFR